MRLISVRTPRMHLWLSGRGFAQVGSTPQVRAESWWRERLMMLAIPLTAILNIARPGLEPMRALSFVGLAMLFSLPIAIARYRARHELSRDYSDFTPELTPWRKLKEFKIESMGEETARITFGEFIRWHESSHNSVDIEVSLRDSQIPQLREQIRKWQQPLVRLT
jgi:hypothetical protein